MVVELQLNPDGVWNVPLRVPVIVSPPLATLSIARCNERRAASHRFGQREARKVDRLARDRARDCARWRTGRMGQELHLDRRTSLSNSRGETKHGKWQVRRTG